MFPVRLGSAMMVLCAFVVTARMADSPAAGRSLVDADKRSLVMILIDGARWDLPDTDAMPHLNSLIRVGVRAEMVPVFPTSSAPNHWALVTGLYPIHSGVYNNDMYDAVNDRYFDPQGSDVVGKGGQGWDIWVHGDPIWAAVTRQGEVSGVIGNWVGAQVQVSVRRPGFFIPYEEAQYDSCLHCGHLLVDLLDQADPSTRPRLLCLWVSQIDGYEHNFGVGSPQAKRASARVDQIVGDFIADLAVRGLSEQVNVVIVSDHGQMSFGDARDIYYLDDLIDMSDLEATPSLPVKRVPLLGLWAKPGHEERVYSRLRAVGPHLHVYRAGELPSNWHCCDQEHGPPLMVVADAGWGIGLHGNYPKDIVGVHGYDNSVRSMHSLFVAVGPAFRRGVTLPVFENVDIHSLLAHLLNIEVGKTDGKLDPLCTALTEPPAACKR